MTFAGNNWKLTDEYPSIDSDELKNDFAKSENLIKQLEELNTILDPVVSDAQNIKASDGKIIETLQKSYLLSKEAGVLLSNISTYANCILSVKSNDAKAKQLQGKNLQLFSQLSESSNSRQLILAKITEDVKNQYLNHETIKHSAYALERQRDAAEFNLSLAEENIVTTYEQNGLNAWGKLYTAISSSIQVPLKTEDGTTENAGLAKAASILKGSNEDKRKEALEAIQSGWTTHRESCAAILNAQIGWRLNENKKRSHTKQKAYLTDALFANRISEKTLNAMLGAVKDMASVGHKALRLQAKLLGKDKLDPWDLLAGCPKVQDETQKFTYNEGIELISKAYGSVNSEMQDFVNLMEENEWIEGSVGDYKRTGAYCTKFYKSRNPRVYMTYQGSTGDVSTLAHELGHAFHNWVLKPTPIETASYPMTLAETASIFGETVVNDYLLAESKTLQDKLTVGWENASSAAAFLINIPARYDLEKALYEHRLTGELTADIIEDYTKKVFSDHYGETLSKPDHTFWQSKLHFYISGLTFYNFPYTFGYLFALGVYAQKDALGDNFYDKYIDLLKDTGSMPSEEVAKKHLGVDIEEKQFWLDSISIVNKQMEDFEKLINEATQQ